MQSTQSPAESTSRPFNAPGVGGTLPPQTGQVVTLQPAKVHVMPVGSLYYARQFLNATKRLTSDSQNAPVRYFLACRSIELGLKAFLYASGWNSSTLKNKLGHDIKKALKEVVKEWGNDHEFLTPQQRECVKRASKPYSKKQFEYFELVAATQGLSTLADIADLTDVAEDICLAVHDRCMRAAVDGPDSK